VISVRCLETRTEPTAAEARGTGCLIIKEQYTVAVRSHAGLSLTSLSGPRSSLACVGRSEITVGRNRRFVLFDE